MAGANTVAGRRAAAAAAAVVVVYWGVFAAANFRGLALYCLPFFDLGLYAQACAALGPGAPNPRVPGLGQGIFNDHLDPVLWATVPWRRWLGGGGAAVLAEALFTAAAVLPLIGLARRGRILPRTAALGAGLMLLNPGNISAVSYPVHPTTWVAGPMAWLIVAVAEGRRRTALVALVVLCACKEEFAFLAAALAVVLAARRRPRWAAETLAVAVLAALAAFALRPWLWGPATGHAAKLVVGLDAGPIAYLRTRILHPGMASRLLSLAATLAPLCLWLGRRRRLPPLWLLAPLAVPLAIRFLGTAWRLHYMGCVMAGAVAALIWACGRAPVPAWVLALSVVAVAWTNVNPTRHAARMLSGRLPQCPDAPARLRSVAAGVAWLAAHRDERALVGPNLVAALGDRAEVYPLGTPVSGAPYGAVLVERAPHGQPWPLTAARVEALIAGWRADPRTQVVCDDGLIFLATGRFAPDR